MKEFNYIDYLKYQKWIKQKVVSGVAEEGTPYYLEKPKISQPHDKLFKLVLSEKREAVELINRILKSSKKLEKDDIEKYSTEHINYVFQKSESDIVYKMKNKDIFFLIEHQSTIDYRMPIRILRYEIEIIEEAIKGKKLTKKNSKLPTVIPIVLYTGNQKWNVKRYIQECQERIPGAKSMKFGEYNIVDVNNYKNDELEKDEFFYSKMMLLEKLTKEEEIFQTLERIAENEKNEINKLLLKRIIALILKGKISEEKIKILLEKVESEEIDMMLEVIEKGYEKQRKIGRAEGKLEGKVEGILETAKKMLKLDISLENIEKATGLSKKEIEKLS